MKISERIYEFVEDFKTGGIRPVPLGRIHLASGNTARLFFFPEGVKIMLPTPCIDNGDIVWSPHGISEQLGSYGEIPPRSGEEDKE